MLYRYIYLLVYEYNISNLKKMKKKCLYFFYIIIIILIIKNNDLAGNYKIITNIIFNII